MVAIDANIFKNSLADAILVTPEEWANEIEQYAKEKNWFRRLSGIVKEVSRVGVAGNSIKITKNTELSTAPLTDGVPTPIQALDFNQIEVSAVEHGGAVQFSKKQLRDQLPTIRADVIQSLGDALAKEEELAFITEALTTTSTGLYPGAKVTGDILATDTMDLALYNKSIVAMRTDDRKAEVFIVHPKVEGDMRLLSDFRDASITGSPMTRESGFIGTYFGVNVFSTSNVTQDAEGAGAAVVTYKNMLLAQRALVVLDKKGVELEIDAGLAIDRNVTFHVTKDYGVQVLNDESIRVVTSA